MKLKVAMIGCGRIAEVYKEVFKELSDYVDVVYAVDSKKERAEKFAANFQGCIPLDDYNACWQNKPNIFHIATPHYLHPVISIAAMEQRINVLTEKPMAISLRDADEMIKTAEKNNVQLGVIFQTRYVKGCMELKEIIEQGVLGRLISARSYLSWSRPDEYYLNSDWKGTWEKEGGGVLIDQAIHSIDRVQWLINDQVEWIEGSMFNRVHKALKVEDVAEAFVRFKKGTLYHLYATNCYGYNSPIEIEIMGENGKVGLKQDLAWVKIKGEDYQEIVDGYDGLSIGPDYWGSSHVTQIKRYYKSILKGCKYDLDGREGRKALEIIQGIYKSAREGKKVYFHS